MLTLIVRQSLKDGTAKTWKLRSTEPTHTFGSSRLADLISVSPAIAGISGIFEYRDDAWWYVDMNFSTGASSAGISALRIDGEKSLALGESTLHLVSVRKEVDLFKRLENMQSAKSTTGKPGKSFQMFMIRQGQQVVETRILPMGKSFKSQVLPLKTNIASVPGENWHRQKVGDLEVSQKTISMDDATALGHLSADQLVDKDSKAAVYFTLAATALIAFLAVFAPKNDNTMTAVTLPKMVQKIIVKTEIKPHKKIPPPEAKPAQQVVVKQQSAPAAGPKAEMPTGSHKVANMLKSISGGRISQLLSKVSAQAAKSGNIIISNGVKAGSANSGRALAAVGSMERSGRDWGNESNGNGVVISTAGKGGGKNAAGMGGLAAGGTGTAGVGLIEEESEITGGLDREIIAQYIKSQLGQILYCYERQLSASPDLFGKVAVKFTIGPAGSVEQQLIGDTTLKNATVEGCILNRVASWKFPAPQGGTRVLVTYPFLFKSTN